MWGHLNKEDESPRLISIPPPSTEEYKLMRRMIDDAERYLNFGSKEIEVTLLKKLSDKINEYCEAN